MTASPVPAETVSPGSPAPLLRVQNVSKNFGGFTALDSVSVDIHPGERFGLIGPNGSGKTTMFNCISGIYRYVEGDIQFEGKSLTGVARHDADKVGQVEAVDVAAGRQPARQRFWHTAIEAVPHSWA